MQIARECAGKCCGISGCAGGSAGESHCAAGELSDCNRGLRNDNNTRLFFSLPFGWVLKRFPFLFQEFYGLAEREKS